MHASHDGWDGERPWETWPLPAAPLGLYVTTLSSLIRRGIAPLLLAYVGVTAVGLVVQVPGWIQQALQAAAVSNPAQNDWMIMVSLVVAALSIPLSLAYAIFFTPVAISMSRIARLAVLAPHEIPTMGSALRQLGKRYWPTLGFFLLAGLLVVAGLCLGGLPGIVLAVLLMAGSYLVVNGTPLTEGFMASGKLVVANWLLVLIYLLIAIPLGLLWFGLAAGMGMGAAATIGPWGSLGATMLVSLIGYFIGLPIFILGNALLITMEAGSYDIDVIPDHEIDAA